ncbi:HNH endonuclease [Streptomyces sp. NBC_01453]|uniref:HNH endonuclease n=1 Tax=Streptomyces sp. NBC_01453 TaxID=2903873 RepID=UPI002E2C85FB|nr:HNH endonuclease [Streptomyces sp. NBC_01453]
MSERHVLNAARRRMRKEQLARRHGQHCAYCRRPFATLTEATLDHVAPRSLWRTWTVTALVLACQSCNHAKADRLPLSLALLLAFTYGGGQSPAPIDSKSGNSPRLDWPLLARLAHANQSTYTATWTADPIRAESTPDLRDCPRHAPVTRSIGRRDCLRAPRLVRACSQSTGEAVPA